MDCLMQIFSDNKENNGPTSINPKEFPYKNKITIAAVIILCLTFGYLSGTQSKSIAFPGKIVEKVIQTPHPITYAVVAAEGKYVIIEMQSLPGLAIYDADKKEIIHIIHLESDNFLYTAGGLVVLVYYLETNLLQTWDLKTLKKIKTKSNPKGSVICNMTMGHSNGNRAFIRYADGTDSFARVNMYLLDTKTLHDITGPQKHWLRNHTSYTDFVHQRADGDMHLISEWESHASEIPGIFCLSQSSWRYKSLRDSTGYFTIGDDGLLYTEVGIIYTNDLYQIGKVEGNKLIPGIGGILFLAIDRTGKIQVHTSGTITPLGPVGNFPEYQPVAPRYTHNFEYKITGRYQKKRFVFDRRIIFDPKHGRIIFIPFGNDRIVQRSFDLKMILDQVGIDYLLVISKPDTTITPGMTWHYQIETLSSTKITQLSLKQGPKGMKLGENGIMEWTVPTNISNPKKVVVIIKNKGGETAYHKFDLSVNEKDKKDHQISID